MQEMVIYGVSFDMVGKQPIVLLKTREGNKFLPIWIGHPEAAAILMKLQGANTPRPMTHDLISEMLSELEVSCSRVAVTSRAAAPPGPRASLCGPAEPQAGARSRASSRIRPTSSSKEMPAASAAWGSRL